MTSSIKFFKTQNSRKIFSGILAVPGYYFTPLYDSWLSSAYVGRKRVEFTLGEILTLWKNGFWRTTCDTCGERIYITDAGGSPLSGRGSA